ncbi:MAG: ABC transporter ATP-binding protein [Chitinophagales bacterium]
MKQLLSLNKYFARYKWRILSGIFFVICANALSVYNPVITKSAVDLIVDNLKNINPQSPLSEQLKGDITWQVFILFLKYLVVALLAGGFTFLMRQTIIVVSRLVEYDLKNEIYDHYQKLDLAFYRRNNTGDMMNRITEDVSRVRMFIGPAIMYSVNLFFTITFAVVSMFLINPTLTLWVLIPLPVLSFAIFFINQIIGKYSTRIQEKLSDLTTTAQETFSGIRVVQAYARESEMLGFFEKESQSYKQSQLDLAKVDSLYFPIMTFLVGCSIIIVVYVGGLQVGEGKLSAGDIAAFLMYTNMLMWPVSSLGWVAAMIQRAIVSQKRINEFLDYKPAINDESGIERQIIGDIELRNVTFCYPDTGIVALKNVSFTVGAGKRLAVIGKTGSGKTTIAELLLRMYNATEGTILIDGVDITRYRVGALRKQIGFVPQDIFLFSETITENIGFGVEKAGIEEARTFARYAVIDKEIDSFPQGYETMVGERGVTLSGGQKQRISIARALIKKPNVLLLDDSLSAVDTTTEKQIQHNLNQLLHDKTAIIITHRIFSLIQFDNIIVLDDGKVVEQGTHEYLLQNKGLYADIYAKQMSEQQDE